MIAVYARVCSKRQDQRAQTNELKAWAKGQDEAAEFYSKRVSGTSMDRPEWQRIVNREAHCPWMVEGSGTGP
jgi:DNA invertase Pin-like site-specific DNA recombinase